MSWIRLDDSWIEHPKIIRAGRDARDLWLASITWCARHLTDGVFPAEVLPVLVVWAGIDEANDQAKVKQIASKLLSTGLWILTTNNEYLVHDYLHYNPSKEEVEELRAARSEAGRRGGKQKASNRVSKDLANAVAKPKQNASKSASKILPPTPTPLIDDHDLLNTPINNDLDLNETINTKTPVLTDTPPFNFSMRVWNKITGMVSVPAGQSDRVIPALEALYYQMGRDENRLIEYLKPYFQAWIGRKTKDGLPYSRGNCTWLYDWAIAGEIPQQSNGESKPKPKRNAGLRARAGMEDDE